MRRTIHRPVALALALLLLGLGCTRPSAPFPPAAPAATSEPTTSVTHDPDEPLASLAWLAGTWVSDDSEGPRTVEHWLAPEGGSVLGVNRAAQGGRTIFEYLRIEAQPEGVAYLASPRGKNPPTRFAAASSGPGLITFEDPEHDFPKRIEYRREGDRLHMRVSGAVDGATKAET